MTTTQPPPDPPEFEPISVPTAEPSTQPQNGQQPALPGIPAEEPSTLVAQRRQREVQAQLMALLDEEGGEERYPWLGVMAMLLAQGYEAKQAAVAAWLCMPKDKRFPATKQELANLLGYSKTAAIAKIAAAESTQVIVQAVTYTQLMSHLADVDAALVAVATQPDYKAERDRSLFYKRVGLLTDQTDVRLTTAMGTGVEQMSSDQIRQRMAEIQARREQVVEHE